MSSLLDDLIPAWDVAERHELRADATAPALLESARTVTLAEMPLVALLFRLRGIRRVPQGSLVEAMLASGFRLLGEKPGREIVVGAVGRPWTRRGGLRDTPDFRAFAEPGWAKMALSVRATDGILATETRVRLTDPASRRRFRLYWLAVRPFSGLVRRLWLRAAVRRVEVDRRGRV